MILDYVKKSVRAAAILTDTYVAGTVLDANQFNQLIVLFKFTKGSLTTAEFKIDFAMERLFSLAYDGQTVNFTAAKRVHGKTSGASANIVSDTDAGATGTLVLSDVKGTFLNNEPLVDDAGGTAVVNGTISETTVWYQETATSVSSGTDTNTLVEHQVGATGNYRVAMPITDRYIKISSKGTGTMTSSSATVDAILGTV